MKGFSIFLFVFLSVFVVNFARVYDEKLDAIKEIEKKLQETKSYLNNINLLIQNEIKAVNSSTGEKDQLKGLSSKITDTKDRYEDTSNSVIKEVIKQDKHVNVIYCIRNVSDYARDDINKLEKNLTQEILLIKLNKTHKINFDSYAASAVYNVIQELTNEYIGKIKTQDQQISNLKKEALTFIERAHYLLGEIEVTVSEPNLSSSYIKIRQKIDKSCKAFLDIWGEKVKSCLVNKNW